VLKIRLIAALVLVLVVSSVPSIPQTAGRHSSHRNAAAASQAPVDINHATLEQLLTVPGLARPWAQRILRCRPYRSKLDLFQEGILPGPLYYQIKDYIVAHREQE
jgi:DNA uptake protein ComE-like DNA-binding protein